MQLQLQLRRARMGARMARPPHHSPSPGALPSRLAPRCLWPRSCWASSLADAAPTYVRLAHRPLLLSTYEEKILKLALARQVYALEAIIK